MPCCHKMYEEDDIMIRCAIYDRVSTDLQVEKGLSLATQKDDLTQYAKDHGYVIVGYYEDEGITARKKMKNRKDLMRLLDDVKANKVDLILVTKLDRWFRNVKDYHNTQEILDAHHCNWKTIYEDYDSSTADGQLKINIMLAVAQNECDRTSERIKAVFRHKEAQGKVISGRMAPYGYKVVNGYVQKDESVSHIVVSAYERYFKTFSIRDVIRYLNMKYGKNAPSDNVIDRLFKNEKYSGSFRGNPNWCEPYLTREQYEQIRTIGTTKQNTGQYEPYIFTSLIKCPICGNNFTGYRKKQNLKNGGQSIYIKYRCGNKFNRHGGASILEKTVENYLIENVLIFLQRDIEKLKSMAASEQGSGNNAKVIHDEMGRLNLMYQKGRITDSYYESQYELLEKKLMELSTVCDIENTIEKRENLVSFFQGDWINLYRSLDAENKKIFWKKYIKDIQVDPKTRKLCGFHFY